MSTPEEYVKEFKKQKREQNATGRIFAAFTIDKIDRKVLETMTDEQINAVRDALIAAESSKKHSIDLRLSIPLYFARYYLLIVGGRDKRRRTVLAEALRDNRGNRSAGKLLSVLGLVVLLGIGALIAFFGAYWLKSELGIDVFPHEHLEDVARRWFGMD